MSVAEVQETPLDLGAAAPIGALAVGLVRLAGAGTGPLVHVAGTAERADALGALLAALAPERRVAVLPPWDCLPHDRIAPSRAVMGRRVGALRWLGDPDGRPDIVVTTAPALIQRIPPRAILRDARVEVGTGEALDDEALRARLLEIGYFEDERVDEPGEFAIRGLVVDLYPAAAPLPCRIEHRDGRIVSIRSYDPLSQRSEVETDLLVIDAASEAILPPEERARFAPVPAEHRLAAVYPALESVFDLVPDARLSLETEARAAAATFRDWIAEPPLPAAGAAGRGSDTGLYLDAETWEREVAARLVAESRAGDDPDAAVPRYAETEWPLRALQDDVRAVTGAGGRVVLAATGERRLARLARRVADEAGAEPIRAGCWAEVVAAPEGSVLAMILPLDEGFRLPDGTLVVTAQDLAGSRGDRPGDAGPTAFPVDMTVRIGDAVVHLDHGIAALEGLDPIGDGTEGVRLRFADDARLVVPLDEVNRLWRYGSEAEAVSLSRLGGTAWTDRKAEVEAEIAATAARMADLARARAERTAPVLEPPRAPYERIVGRFPYAPTRDQRAAIAATLADLASGRPMDRLVCGDVGFGKTEVAVRAIAACVLAGRQAVLAAPTTVLARQHAATLRRRFAGLGFEIAELSRLVEPAEARRVRAGLASGEIRLAVGTHALAQKGVAFHDLGLVVIDEEQRFGVRHKERLRALAADVHVLTLTATPIPRTLQVALVGLKDLSVIATAPVLRQPIRTVVAPEDDGLIASAIERERRRGGQSFVVCPRIEDIEPMRARLAGLLPGAEILAAHGRMEAGRIDDVMLRFADGDGDVLLATAIIESGLDVPNANTILVHRPERFGLAQLHQLRGRVGRAARRAVAWLLTDPAHPPSDASMKRLKTLAALDRLGAGFAISARDLDLRGAGDLVGEEQAGHVKVIGLALYQHLLGRALAAARGKGEAEDWAPVLNLGVPAAIPADYVPEPEVRLDLYFRLERLDTQRAVAAFEDELDDRFGPLPAPARDLVAAARVRAACRRLGIARIDAGPRAIAATFRAIPPEKAAQLAEEGFAWSSDRLLARTETDDSGRTAAVVKMVARIARTLRDDRAGRA
ncbi:TRCF domain-containing protein [Prosthecomicrobium sp. N25]|uniref:TRCF domain-containing protein n=1 Tax=Prosthecomicrobium sp. N25 TaxID=3129254 RepID=UPI003077B378